MLAPWKKSYDQPTQHFKKQRHYFANKDLCSQCYGFSSCYVWMWELDCEEGWAPKNWCFWTMVCEKTLESPLDCKNQSVLKEINPEYSWEGLMLKLQYIGPPDAKSWLMRKNWCWERLNAGEEDDRGQDGWMASQTQWVWASSGRWWRTEKPGRLQSMGSQRVWHNWATEQQQNTDLHIETSFKTERLKPTVKNSKVVNMSFIKSF